MKLMRQNPIMKKITFLLITLFALSSCEKETFVDYFIENQSTSTITVNGSDIIHSTRIDHSISEGEKKEVSSWTKRGKEIDYFEPVSMFGEDLIITNSNGDTLTKNYKLHSNWTSNVNDSRTTAEHEYILVVTDSDF